MSGIQLEARRTGEGAVWHIAPTATNTGQTPATLQGYRCPIITLQPEGLCIQAFRSAWGRENTPAVLPFFESEIVFGSSSGRSANGYTPFCMLMEENSRVTAIAVCWSGNWQIRVTPEGTVSYGMDEAMLSCTLAPGETLTLPGVLVSQAADAKTALRALTDYVASTWLPPSRLTYPMVEWNHWWCFEDDGITETIFLENAAKAKALGFTQCTLDAGWFGDANSPVHWTACRGDWHLVNKARFPHGLRYLADQVHQMDMRFGLWIEPEAMGEQSALRREHPQWEALRDGEPMPQSYMCLGNPEAAAHLAKTLDMLVTETNCDFLKIDFNVDPGCGCNRADHGHQPGMGLFAHIKALYAILDGLRAKHPALVIENCSSGGMRNDLEMLRHTDMAFLSDPDETVHALQVLWGASLMMPPGRMLHWSHSQTRQRTGSRPPFPPLDYGSLPDAAIRASLRAAMLHPFGMSRDLRMLLPHEASIIAAEIEQYKRLIVPLLDGKLYRLTGPFLRDGERTDDGRTGSGIIAEATACCAFQLQHGNRGIIMAFYREDMPSTMLALQGLNPAAAYRITNADTGTAIIESGEKLLRHGILLPALIASTCYMASIEATADI